MVIFVACGKDGNGPSYENDPFLRTDWLDDGLYGKVKQTIQYSFGKVRWDAVANKPVVQQKYMRDKEITDYNNAGYQISYELLENKVTNAHSDGVYVVVLESQLLTSGKYTCEYDGKNRLTGKKEVEYYYLSSIDGRNIYEGYEGDTLSYITVNSSAQFELVVDTMISKIEVSYNDDAKLATILDYELQVDGTWEETGKATVTLNNAGYVDDNSTYTFYRVKTNSISYEISGMDYRKNDAQGNWVETYSYDSPDQVYGYSTRDITYY
jgi:hypothetical protein